MKILVTGVAGLIGSHLCDKLLEMGCEVVGVDNLSYGNLDNLKESLLFDKFTFIESDCTEDFWRLSKTCICEVSCDCDLSGFHYVFHLASYKKTYPKVGFESKVTSSDVMINNSKMIKQVSDFCKEDNTRLIFTSTSDVYGNSSTFLESEPITIGPPTNERYSYAMSKLYGEQFILNEATQSNLNASIVRIFGCASSRSNKSWSGGHVPLFADKASKGEDIHIHGDGLQTRSIGHAIDIADGLALIVSNLLECKGEIINLGTDEQSTVKDVAEYIVSSLDSKSTVVHTPREVVFGDYKEILVRFANTTKAKKLLGFNIKYSTRDVLDEIINAVTVC